MHSLLTSRAFWTRWGSKVGSVEMGIADWVRRVAWGNAGKEGKQRVGPTAADAFAARLKGSPDKVGTESEKYGNGS